MSKRVPTAIYLHIPFCIHRCGYCDFNTYAGFDANQYIRLIPDYVTALCREIEYSSAAFVTAVEGEPEYTRSTGCTGCTGCTQPHQPHQPHQRHSPASVHTVFFGGGTPSILPISELAHILEALKRSFDLQPDLEITLEANPGTVSLEYLKGLRAQGINRLSLGMQSSNPEELRLLERKHSYEDVIQSVLWARQAGFTNLNLDLIFGLPDQPMEAWQRTLTLALGLKPEHLSLYALTLEKGTLLARWVERGLLHMPDPDLAADMYEWASERLEVAGFIQYEISNWGKGEAAGYSGYIRRLPEFIPPSTACRHNLQYWRNLPYLGFGAGAHGYWWAIRTANVLTPWDYISKFSTSCLFPFPRTPATESFTTIDRQAEIGETMMMGLRLVREGVRRVTFRERFGEDLEDVFPKEIKELIDLGLLEWADNGARLRLTPRGRLLGNQVFMRFI